MLSITGTIRPASNECPEPGVIFGSKAIGEPPLMLAISAREAIRDAIAAFGAGGLIAVDSPLMPERYWAAKQARSTREAPVMVLQEHGPPGA